MELYHLSVQGSRIHSDPSQTAVRGRSTALHVLPYSPRPQSLRLAQFPGVVAVVLGPLGTRVLSIKYAKHGNSVATSPGDPLGGGVRPRHPREGLSPLSTLRREEHYLEALQV